MANNTRNCEHCESTFEVTRPTKRFCSDRCGRNAGKRRAAKRKQEAARAARPTYKCGWCNTELPGLKTRWCNEGCRSKWLYRNDEAYHHRTTTRRKQRAAKEYDELRGPLTPCKHCGSLVKWRGANYCTRNECQLAHGRVWKRTNLDKRRDYRRARRARIRTTKVELIRLEEVLERDKRTCHICGEHIAKNRTYPHPFSASLDHVTPLARGGTHTADNVAASHLRCNLKKSDKLIENTLTSTNAATQKVGAQ